MGERESRNEAQYLEQELKALFGAEARSEGPLAASGAGLRLRGVDLCRRLDSGQVAFLLDALSRFRIVCIAGQDLANFSLAHFDFKDFSNRLLPSIFKRGFGNSLVIGFNLLP